MKKQVKYKEPAGYFTPEMLKAAKEWEKKHNKSEKPAKKGK